MPLEAPSAKSEKITAEVLKKGLQIYKPPVISNAPTITQQPKKPSQGYDVRAIPTAVEPEPGTFAYGWRNLRLIAGQFGVLGQNLFGPPTRAIGIAAGVTNRLVAGGTPPLPGPYAAEKRAPKLSYAQFLGLEPVAQTEPTKPAKPAAGYAQYVPATTEAARLARERTEGRYGLLGTLTQAQLAYASKLTGEAIFGYDPFGAGFAPGVDRRPKDISTDVALQLPFGLDSPTYHKSQYFKDAFMEAFGVEGFANVQEFLTALGYVEEQPGKWHRQDQAAPISGYGGGGGGGGGPIVIPSGGGSGTRAGPVGSPGGLVQWRIGL